MPQGNDPRHANIIRRCESRKPMGIFRSTDNEFLLCYDGKLPVAYQLVICAADVNRITQNSVYTSIGMAIQIVLWESSNGKALPIASPSTHHTSLYSTRDLSKSDILLKDNSFRLFKALTSIARGMGEGISRVRKRKRRRLGLVVGRRVCIPAKGGYMLL